MNGVGVEARNTGITMPDQGPIIIIRNPAAGQRRGPFIERVVEQLVAAGLDVITLETKAAGHATALAAEIIEKHPSSLVVAAGGDGTIREVAMGLVGTNARLAIIPAGTANVLARELGYMKRKRFSPERTVEVLLRGREEKLYPFKVTFHQKELLGLCWLGAGFDAEVLAHVNSRMKALIGRSAFVPATLKALWREPKGASIPFRFEGISTDGNQSGQAAWAVLANIQRYAGPFTLTRQTSATETGLACMMFKKPGALARIVDQAQIAVTTLDTRADVTSLNGGTIHLGGAQTHIQLDGDYLGKGPVTVCGGASPIIVKCL